MASYTKATDFAAKDALLSGDPNKIIKGTEIDNEFNAIAVAVSTKVDSVSPAFTGTPTAPTASPGTSTTQLATTAFVTAERTATTTLTNKTISGSSNTITNINLATASTGTLPVANGGTGQSTLSSGALLLGNGTSGVSVLSGTSVGQIPQWSGTAWGVASLPGSGVSSVTASSPLASSGGATPDISFTGVLPVANGGTGGLLPVANGGTGATSLAGAGLCTLSGTQTLSGEKTFSNIVSLSYNFTANSSVYFDAGTTIKMDISGTNRFNMTASVAQFNMSDVQKVGGGTFNTISDRRHKQDITAYEKGLTELKQLSLVNYRYTSEFMKAAAPSKQFVGLIAQDVQNTGFSDSVVTDDKGYLALDTSQLTYALINAVKELSSKVEVLEAEVAALKAV